MTTQPNQKTIILAGATGDLGGRIARALVRRGATVKALARRESDLDAIVHLRGAGVVVEKVDFDDFTALVSAMQGASCVVSALSGLRKVMIGAANSTQWTRIAIPKSGARPYGRLWRLGSNFPTAKHTLFGLPARL